MGKLKQPCEKCSGSGLISLAVKETIVIPKGVYQGITLRLKGKGHNSTLSKKCGDLLINISIRPHNYYKRDLFNIITDRYISVT